MNIQRHYKKLSDILRFAEFLIDWVCLQKKKNKLSTFNTSFNFNWKYKQNKRYYFLTNILLNCLYWNAGNEKLLLREEKN